MKITKRQLRRIIREETAKATKQYDDDSALKGDQSKLPDGLQKGIIDKTVEDREETEDEKKNEVRRLVRQILREKSSILPEGFAVSKQDLVNVGLPIGSVRAGIYDRVVVRLERVGARRGLPILKSVVRNLSSYELGSAAAILDALEGEL